MSGQNISLHDLDATARRVNAIRMIIGEKPIAAVISTVDALHLAWSRNEGGIFYGPEGKIRATDPKILAAEGQPQKGGTAKGYAAWRQKFDRGESTIEDLDFEIERIKTIWPAARVEMPSISGDVAERLETLESEAHTPVDFSGQIADLRAEVAALRAEVAKLSKINVTPPPG